MLLDAVAAAHHPMETSDAQSCSTIYEHRLISTASSLKTVQYRRQLTAMFKQCGINDEFVMLGKRNESMNVLNFKRWKGVQRGFLRWKGNVCISQQLLYAFNRDYGNACSSSMHTMLTLLAKPLIDYRIGDDGHILTRPIIYDFIFRQIPKDRIHLGKKILLTDQDSKCVMIRCNDDVKYKGDIHVDSDGAYSAVRQNLYLELIKEGKLPASDSLPLPFRTFYLLGQTRKLDVIEFPDLAKESC